MILFIDIHNLKKKFETCLSINIPKQAQQGRPKLSKLLRFTTPILHVQYKLEFSQIQ